jgi:dienelactone hydrolase
MNPPPRRLLAAALALTAIAAALAQSGDSSPIGAASPKGLFLDGRWEGSVDLGEGPEPIVLRLFPADPQAGKAAAGLLDLPARKLFGCPMDTLERDSGGIAFSLRGGAPLGGLFELETSPSSPASGGPFLASGTARRLPDWGGEGEGAPAEGPFFLAYSGLASRGPEYGEEYVIDTGRGLLPGSLLVPEGEGAPPIVLILSGAAEDRDGDNYSVPGRSDALAELAIALRDRGLASLRFDKRGTGGAYRFASREEDLLFDYHVADARAAISSLAASRRFSRIVVLGYGEGALVGAAALGSPEPRSGGETSELVAGLAALCASGKTEIETVVEALSSTPEENKPEAEAIMSALESGGTYADPSPYFADFFRPSAQPYLASLFRFDIRAAFEAARLGAELPSPVLVIAGARDLQVPAGESELLASARHDAAYRVLSGMSHALKEAGEDEEANYASFTDPSLPLAGGLADLVEAFVNGKALPGVDPREAAAGSDAFVPAGTDQTGPQGGEDSGEGPAR